MLMLKVQSPVVDVPGAVWVLARSLLFVAVTLALLVSAGVAYAQGTPTVPTIESVAVTSDPGEDGGYAIGDEIQVGLTLSEAVTVTGIPQLTLNVGGQNHTAEYSEGTTTTRLLFTYTVLSGDEDTDGIAVVANSLALNGGSIRAGSANAALTHAGLQSDDHKVDGIAPTVTVGGETRTYVPPGRQFNVVFYFSEKVYGITDQKIVVTNGAAHDVIALSGSTRWDAIIVPAGEGPVTVELPAGAAVDAYGNPNATSSGPLRVIAADPVTVEVTHLTTDFVEGADDAKFLLTRSRDNGTTTVSLTVERSGDFMTGTVAVSQSSGATSTRGITFNGAASTLEVTFEAGETSKTISFPTLDDNRDEPNGTVTLSVPANPAQYRYIPGFMSSAVSQVRDNDEPVSITLVPDADSPLLPLAEGDIATYVLLYRVNPPVSAVYLEFTEGLELLHLGGTGSRGYVHEGNGRIKVALSGRRATRFSVPTLENDSIGKGGPITLVGRPGDGYVFSENWFDWTYRVNDDDSPPSVTLAAPGRVTEGDKVRYTIARTADARQSREEMTVNVQLEQTGDYIAWTEQQQPDTAGRVTIPVTFARRATTATIALDTEDDQATEANGLLSARLLSSSDNKYTVATTTAVVTTLHDNEQPRISVEAVNAEITEGADAQFRFTRVGDSSATTTLGLWVGGLPKIMSTATKAIVLTSQTEDPAERLTINGAVVDYILEVGKTGGGPERLPAQLSQVNLNAAGIDVGATSHFVAVPQDRAEPPVHEFAAFTADLYRLADWLAESEVETVVMESTGVYWIPLFGVLEERGFEVMLVDPDASRTCPGARPTCWTASGCSNCTPMACCRSLPTRRGTSTPAQLSAAAGHAGGVRSSSHPAYAEGVDPDEREAPARHQQHHRPDRHGDNRSHRER